MQGDGGIYQGDVEPRWVGVLAWFRWIWAGLDTSPILMEDHNDAQAYGYHILGITTRRIYWPFQVLMGSKPKTWHCPALLGQSEQWALHEET